jgi:hypothetical protein
MRVTANAKTRGRRFPKQSKERFSAFGAMRKTKNIRAISSPDGDVKSEKRGHLADIRITIKLQVSEPVSWGFAGFTPKSDPGRVVPG